MTRVPAGRNARSGLRTYALLVLALAAALAAALVDSGSGARAALPEAPPLPDPPARCSAASASARQRAAEAARTARARMDRYPFAAGDGPRALALLAEARDCLTLAGERTGAGALAARAAEYRARIAADYRDHLLRLRHALALQMPEQARDDLRYLRALLGDDDGPFNRALRGLELEIAAGARGDRGEQP